MKILKKKSPSFLDNLRSKENSHNCVFCRIVKGEIKASKILQNKNFIVIKDANPKVPGHCLVIPKKHYKTFLDLPKGLYEELLKTVKDATGTFSGDFNLVVNSGKVAGQEVPHFHMHILPRQFEDGFKLGC